ncbi:lysophospholipid acyltransferase family protein [Flavobacterium sediminilitoris]|uniref:Lysophospholipid acyltransferase family protein n=1 Tax=Flavobacterium sediminilitoris TaxID=2024526 RepID=A0ABY4HLM2_9FLAO|nr:MULTISPECIES: lysophospholipid acyltransferase family protein [Flavobacterium]UOX33746.1 lysophospholipid acyltransferase family protein [Flavobacterium sediminilitoris]
MQLIVYILLYPLLFLISILPFRLLYIFSDFIYFMVYRVIGYRKKVVRENLAMALPHLSTEERKNIEKKFYSHMCDMFLEMIKTMTISRKEMEKRYKFINLDVYMDLEKKKKSIALLCAHYASYEWVISMNYHITFKGYGIYKRISNKYFDKLVHDIRSKFKATLITTKDTISTIEQNQKDGILGIYGFASDQSPKSSIKSHWSTFMGIETPIHVGAEIISKRLDMNVVFLKTKKVKRGYYEATLEVMSEDAKSIPNFEISDAFIRKVEEQIYEAPEYYLWTHKRWKHKKENRITT